jgi:hypothetical protein
MRPARFKKTGSRGNTPSSSRQPTGFRGNNQRPWSQPTKWRLPEEGENNKRIIDNKPYTFNPNSKRWEPDSTPDSGQQQVANVVPSTPPSAVPPTVPPSPSATDMKGAFFSNGYATPDMSVEKQKAMLALQMIHMKSTNGHLPHTFGKEKSELQFTGGAIFVDHAT